MRVLVVRHKIPAEVSEAELQMAVRLEVLHPTHANH